MKKVLILTFFVVASLNLVAQENQQQLYLLMEFMSVDDENESDYLEVEQFWTKIHKQRIADKDIIGWDLWNLKPGGTEQGSQYMTTTLYSSLSAMLQGMPPGKFQEYMTKAHASLNQEEIDKMMAKTVTSRDMAHMVYCKEVNTTKGDFKMKVGTVMALDIMKQLDDTYEKMEIEIFKPWHQEQVDNGKKGEWGLARIILPTGSEAYGTHLTYSMYNNIDELAASMENWGEGMDLKTELAANEGLKTRDWKEVKIATLVMMVR